MVDKLKRDDTVEITRGLMKGKRATVVADQRSSWVRGEGDRVAVHVKGGGATDLAVSSVRKVQKG